MRNCPSNPRNVCSVCTMAALHVMRLLFARAFHGFTSFHGSYCLLISEQHSAVPDPFFCISSQVPYNLRIWRCYPLVCWISFKLVWLITDRQFFTWEHNITIPWYPNCPILSHLSNSSEPYIPNAPCLPAIRASFMNTERVLMQILPTLVQLFENLGAFNYFRNSKNASRFWFFGTYH